MKTLIIDATFEKLIVGYVDKNVENIKEIDIEKSNHQKILLTAINEVLSEAKINLSDIECIALVVGPGSFTGIRIGISTALGLTFESDIKRLEVSAFEVLGYKYTGKVEIEAGKGNKYVADVKDGNVVNVYFNEAQSAEKNCISRKDVNYRKNLSCVVFDKINGKKFSKTYTPIYVRESQAERNYVKNN